MSNFLCKLTYEFICSTKTDTCYPEINKLTPLECTQTWKTKIYLSKFLCLLIKNITSLIDSLECTKTWFRKINKEHMSCFCKWTLQLSSVFSHNSCIKILFLQHAGQKSTCCPNSRRSSCQKPAKGWTRVILEVKWDKRKEQFTKGSNNMFQYYYLMRVSGYSSVSPLPLSLLF